MLQQIAISLRGSFPGGKSLTGVTFAKRLRIDAQPLQLIGEGKPWQSARVVLAAADFHEFQSLEEPHEAFAAKIHELLLQAAKVLATIDRQLVASLREGGLQIDIFGGLLLDQSQFDLILPAEFVGEAGRLGLSVDLVSND